jgi:hypothetical protein
MIVLGRAARRDCHTPNFRVRQVCCHRTLDTCFEMSDGDSVFSSLVRRAKAKPTGRPARNLYRYIVQVGAEAAYGATKHLSGADLMKHAAEERERARKAFADLIEKR